MPYPNYSPQEVAARGEQIYEQRIRDQVEPDDKGKFVIIDIKTGDYEIDRSDLAATKRALAKRPEAVLYGMRIGYPTTHRIGARFTEARPG